MHVGLAGSVCSDAPSLAVSVVSSRTSSEATMRFQTHLHCFNRGNRNHSPVS